MVVAMQHERENGVRQRLGREALREAILTGGIEVMGPIAWPITLALVGLFCFLPVWAYRINQLTESRPRRKSLAVARRDGAARGDLAHALALPVPAEATEAEAVIVEDDPLTWSDVVLKQPFPDLGDPWWQDRESALEWPYLTYLAERDLPAGDRYLVRDLIVEKRKNDLLDEFATQVTEGCQHGMYDFQRLRWWTANKIAELE